MARLQSGMSLDTVDVEGVIPLKPSLSLGLAPSMKEQTQDC